MTRMDSTIFLRGLSQFMGAMKSDKPPASLSKRVIQVKVKRLSAATAMPPERGLA